MLGCLALSAIEPVVYDLFLVRVKADNKELEAQRMVIVQTLLKLVRYNKVNAQAPSGSSFRPWTASC